MKLRWHLTALMAVACTAGCTLWSQLPDPWFWTQEDRPPVETPAERLQRYRRVAEQADELSLEQQRRLAAQIANQLTQEPDPLVRQQMVRTLGHLAGPEAAKGLNQALKDPSVQVQVEAVRAWQRRGSKEALPVLAQLLPRSDVPLDVRLAAVRALGELKAKEAVPLLAPLLDDPDPAIQYRTVRSLEQITGRYYGEDVRRWKRALAGQQVPEEPRWSLKRWWRSVF